MSYPNTPGVKVKEVSLLPPSIVQVSTAIPVFLGYTEKGPGLEPVRIGSLKEYEAIFGGAYQYEYDVVATSTPTYKITGITQGGNSAELGDFFFYEALKMYFLNGGGACYIISVQKYAAAVVSTTGPIDPADFQKGLELIDKLDEPTLIAFPEAVGLSELNYGTVASDALAVAGELKDKFVLIDTANDTVLTDNAVRDSYRMSLVENLSYGAAYYPHVEVNMNYTFNKTNSMYTVDSGTAQTLTALETAGGQAFTDVMAALLQEKQFSLPPSSLIAGVYASVDRNSGFWKAPANVALQGVIKPTIAISDTIQNDLNVDATSGKSINAIRSFTGKGNLVWGARTLMGNSNEWRYIPVRRLFMTVEESVKKATSQFVFENNDSKTWVKVNAMISSYLNGLWRQGGLTGATKEDAYFVQVGLGTTMTQEDVLAGKMIVKIGLAAVRPAEFIILEFSHFVNQ